jgi:hypothetical protein
MTTKEKKTSKDKMKSINKIDKGRKQKLVYDVNPFSLLNENIEKEDEKDDFRK